MSEAVIQIEGFIANELSVRNAGEHRVVDVSVPHTPRKFNKDSGQYENAGETTWYRASFWNEHADAVLISVGKGTLVHLTGGLVAKTYTKNDGSTGVNLELVFPTIAAVVRKPKRGGTAGSPAASQGQSDQWATPAAPSASGGDVWNAPGSFNDETPF